MATVENEKSDTSSVRKAPTPAQSGDVEEKVVVVEASNGGLKRQMKNRHIAMIRYVLSFCTWAPFD